MSDDTEPGPDERTCPECGAVVHRSADFCPECDVSLYREKVTEDDLDVDISAGGDGGGSTRWWLVVIVLVVLVLGVAAIGLGYVSI